jgi:hypothetical protein
MTAQREAVVLPGLFLTALLLGSLRIAGTTGLVPPSPYALVLGLLLVRLVIQSGALAPERLLSVSRSALANLNGFVVLTTLWAGAAQVLAVLTPESGVPRLAFSVFFLILLLSTGAAAPDRPRLLRSLAVTFGAAFVLKFTLLAAISAPGAGPLRRAMLALLDGVTLGALVQEVAHPATAYLALLSVVLFLIGVCLLPYRDTPPHENLMRMDGRSGIRRALDEGRADRC